MGKHLPLIMIIGQGRGSKLLRANQDRKLKFFNLGMSGLSPPMNFRILKRRSEPQVSNEVKTVVDNAADEGSANSAISKEEQYESVCKYIIPVCQSI